MHPTTQPHSSPKAHGDVIMSGPLHGFDVPSVLQAVSHSREATVLKLWGANKRSTGQIRLKGGRLLDAVHGQDRGKVAFHAILASREHHFFRVERAADQAMSGPGVGQLAALLLEYPQTAQVTASRPPRHRIRPVTSSFTPADSAPGLKQSSTKPPPLAPVAATINGELAQHLAEAKSLEGLLLVKVPAGQLVRAWTRSAPGILPDMLARYVGRVTQSHIGCLSEMMPASGGPRITIELPSASLVIESLNDDLVAGYVFSSNTPLGLLRLVISQLHPPLSEFSRAL